MGFKFETPFRYKMIIATNLVLMLSTYVLFWRISLVTMIFPIHILLETIISVILIMRGETVHVFKFAVIILTIIFVIVVVIFHATSQCCYAPEGLWVTLLIFYCVFRCIYVGMLFLLDKASCKTYDKRQMWEQTIAQMEQEPFSRPHIVPTYPNQGLIAYDTLQATPTRSSVQGYTSASPATPRGIGFDPILPKTGDNNDYGWAV